MTINKSFLNGLTYWQELSGVQEGMLIYGGNEEVHTKKYAIKSWKNFTV